MGKARHRVAPEVANHVNRNLESLSIRLVSRIVKMLPPPWAENKRGRRPHSPKTVAICCILRILLCKTYDEMESWCKTNAELHRVLRTTDIPTHSVLHRGMEKLTLAYIRKVIRYLIIDYRKKGMTVALDSSGFSISRSSKWFDIRIKRVSTKKDFMKLHISIDVETGLILSFTITASNVNDTKEFKRLLRYLPRIAKCLADAGYISRKNCSYVAIEKRGKPYLMFKVNSTGKAKGSRAWKESFREYKENSESWLAVYHLRSIIESVFGSMKRRWSDCIFSKRAWLRKRELALRVFAYDIKQVLYLRRAKELGIPLRTPVTRT